MKSFNAGHHNSLSYHAKNNELIPDASSSNGIIPGETQNGHTNIFNRGLNLGESGDQAKKNHEFHRQ